MSAPEQWAEQARSDPRVTDAEDAAPRPDPRSVGELLRAADSHSRAVLLTVDHTRAEAIARTMPVLLESATGLWRTLASTTVDRTRAPEMMDRVTSIAAAIRATQEWGGWPPPGGSLDPELSMLILTLNRAHEL